MRPLPWCEHRTDCVFATPLRSQKGTHAQSYRQVNGAPFSRKQSVSAVIHGLDCGGLVQKGLRNVRARALPIVQHVSGSALEQAPSITWSITSWLLLFVLERLRAFFFSYQMPVPLATSSPLCVSTCLSHFVFLRRAI